MSLVSTKLLYIYLEQDVINVKEAHGKSPSPLQRAVSPRLANFEQALASNESVTEWDDADTALRAALYHLRHLSQTWKSVLSRGVYQMTMGNLVDLILTLFLDPVLKAKDITEPAGRFVHSLFLDAARGTAEVFLVGTPGNNDANVDHRATNNMEQHFQLAKNYSTMFDKLRAVGQFMCMRLDEVQRGLEDGAFRYVTARELSHLLISTFEESVKRNEMLNVLASK